MRFRHTETGNKYNPNQVRKQFNRLEVDGRKQFIMFGADPEKWDDKLLAALKLERVSE